ncbi:SatD family protein [Erysipelothrix urinaevulpis]|uniref:SatD family protein n=1 Tax=Erysipelothrix urinaevulpis TaxID=2683717 RepID=UPI001356D399|nr:SatD family protein [Erysipelothrix urinaevulpis]
MYIALIGDIINSKDYKNRNKIQDLLRKKINSLNDKYKKDLKSPITITLGDEFQCLIKTVEVCFLIIDELSLYMSLNDVELRFGIGIGTISTDIDENISIGADGPAYWNARFAIEVIHKEHDHRNTSTYLKIDDKPQEQFLNSVIRLQDLIRNNWTYSQKEFVYKAITIFGYNEIIPKNLVEAMRFSSSQVSNRLASTSIRQYVTSRVELSKQLSLEDN